MLLHPASLRLGSGPAPRFVLIPHLRLALPGVVHPRGAEVELAREDELWMTVDGLKTLMVLPLLLLLPMSLCSLLLAAACFQFQWRNKESREQHAAPSARPETKTPARRPRLRRSSEHLHHIPLERLLLLNRDSGTNLQHETNPSEIRTVVAMQPAAAVCCGEHHTTATPSPPCSKLYSHSFSHASLEFRLMG